MKDPCHRLSKAALAMLLLGLFAVYLLQVGSSQVSGSTAVRVQPSETDVHVGDTLSVSVGVESVENLYGLDVMLSWNSSVLQFQSVDLRLGVESHSDGVLHEDSNAEIYIAENNASEAEYHLAATSVSPASSFNGSGTVFSVGFKAVNVGHSSLGLEAELADHPPPGGTANLIEHTDAPGSVESTEGGSGEPTGGNWLILALIAFGVIILAIAIGALVYMRRR